MHNDFLLDFSTDGGLKTPKIPHWDNIRGHQTQWLGRNKIMITSKNFSHHHEKILEPYIWRQWWDFTIQF